MNLQNAISHHHPVSKRSGPRISLNRDATSHVKISTPLTLTRGVVMKLVGQLGFHFVISFCMAVAMLLTARADDPATSASSVHPDLTGIVKDSEGKPLDRASVFIYTAGPKEGTGILCPSCY